MYRMINVLLAAMISTGVIAMADNATFDGTMWHDGWAAYQVTVDGDRLVFEGGTLHEGGYKFYLADRGENRFELLAGYEGEEFTGLIGGSIAGETVQYREIGGQKVFIVTDDAGDVTDILLPLTTSLEDVINDDNNNVIDGVYRSEDGKTFAFDGNGNISFDSNLSQWIEMEVKYVYDTPSNVFTVDGAHYCWMPAENGLYFSQIISLPGEEWIDDDDQDYTTVAEYELTKISSLKNKGAGIWPITGQRLLTSGFIANYGVPVMRLMRNDVYARHGYIFKSEDLKEFFEAQSWYKPVTDDINAISLSDIERVNVSLLRYMEKTYPY